MSVKNCGVFEERSELPVVSISSTTNPLPEPVEGSSGDFFFVLSFGGSKRKNIEGEYLLSCLSF
jgi:hypothetical protein